MPGAYGQDVTVLQKPLAKEKLRVGTADGGTVGGRFRIKGKGIAGKRYGHTGSGLLDTAFLQGPEAEKAFLAGRFLRPEAVKEQLLFTLQRLFYQTVP